MAADGADALVIFEATGGLAKLETFPAPVGGTLKDQHHDGGAQHGNHRRPQPGVRNRQRGCQNDGGRAARQNGGFLAG